MLTHLEAHDWDIVLGCDNLGSGHLASVVRVPESRLSTYRAKNTNSEIDYRKICIANLEEVSTLPKKNFLFVFDIGSNTFGNPFIQNVLQN